MVGRRLVAAALTVKGQAVLVGHAEGVNEAVVWRVSGGRLVRSTRAPWCAVGVAPDGDGVLVIGGQGQTLHVEDATSLLGRVTDRKAALDVRGVACLTSGAMVAFGAAGQIHWRVPSLKAARVWEARSIAPPLPRGGAGKQLPAGTASPQRPAIIGVAGDVDSTLIAFGADGAAWSWSGKLWRALPLPEVVPWTCATSRPTGAPVVAGPGLALAAAGAKWQAIELGEIVPTALAALGEWLFVADGEAVWRLDDAGAKPVLREPVRLLAASKKGLLAVAERDVFLSIDGARWARLL